MSCYLRHINEVLKEAGIQVTKENRKEVDEAIHHIVNVHYKDCPKTWRAVKEIISRDRSSFIERLKAEMALKE